MSKIRVGLRVRPLSDREVDGGFPVVVAVEDNSAFITDIRVPERPKADSRERYRQFKFDHAFWLGGTASEGASQSEVYREMGPPLEKSVLQGYNACLLAYGQSGTGKTHTMLGSKDEPGIIPRLCHNIWEKLKSKEVKVDYGATGPVQEDPIPQFRMEVSFIEIYREKVRDLLNPKNQLKVREHPQFGPHLQNLCRMEVSGENGLLDLLWEGECRRAIGTTGSNRRSSRSHAIWTIYLTRPKPNSSDFITNQVHLVDLAGSEKAGFATTKNLLAEGADINRSLVALGNVISSLAEKAQYIPYRDSALTWLLKDSLGGNATTAIIITSSPASSCHAQTLNSFRFAQRARLVENSPRINLTSTPTNLGTGSTGSAALYSIMSAFEIKKDISRLSRVIRSAQNLWGLRKYLVTSTNPSSLPFDTESSSRGHFPHSHPGMTSPYGQRWSPRTGFSVKGHLPNWFMEDMNRPKLCFDPLYNGGLLRGLAPRASWNRLINALEGFNQIEAEHVKLQRAASEDTTTSILTSSTKSDAMIQADLVTSEEPSSATSSKFNSPSRIMGTEVFIPCSNSIKCLTWQQEEPTVVPRPPSPSSDEEEKYASCKMTPPTTPSSSSSRLRASNAKAKAKGRHFNFPLPVKYSVTQQLDHASRISERIHRSFTGEKSERFQIEPRDVQSYLCEGDSPLIRERIPTLVSPKDLDQIFRTCSEQSVDHKREKCVPVRCKSVEQFLQSEEDSSESSTLAEFAVPNSVPVMPFEHTDMDCASEEEMKGSEVVVSSDQKKLRSRYRTVTSGVPKRNNLILNIPPISPELYVPYARMSTTFEGLDHQAVSEGEMKGSGVQQNQRGTKCRMVGCNIPISGLDYPWIPSDETYYFPSEWALSSQSTSSSSSSSATSLTKVPCPQKPVWVHVIPEESESIEFLNESILDIFNRGSDDQLFEDTYYPPCRVVTRDPPQIPSPSSSQSNFGLEAYEDVDELESADETHRHRPKNGIAGTKFRNHFKQEYLQMEEVGKRLNDLKQLMQMSRRFDIAKPYLDKISSLDKEDHSQPDQKLDAEITDCCGWNVDTELQKVNTEITSLNKLLKTGITPLVSAPKSNPCRRDSSTSTATVASTSSTAASYSTGSPTSPRCFRNPPTGRSKCPQKSTNHPNSARFPSETVQTARISYSDSWAARTVGNGHPSHEVMPTSREDNNTAPSLPAYLRREHEASHPAWRGAYNPSNSSLSSSYGSSSLMGLRRDTSEGILGQVPHLQTTPLDLISNCSTLSYYQNGIGPLDSSRSVSRGSSLSVTPFSPVGHGSPRPQRSEGRGVKMTSRNFQGSHFNGPDSRF